MTHRALPANALQPRNGVKVLVAAQKRQCVLPGQRRDPEIIRRNRTPLPLEPVTNLGVSLGRLRNRRQPAWIQNHFQSAGPV